MSAELCLQMPGHMALEYNLKYDEIYHDSCKKQHQAL